MPEFKPIETQEAFDAAIKARLERHTKTVTEAVTKQYEGWISPDDAKKNTEALTKEITDLKEKLSVHETTIADLTAKNKVHENRSAKQKIAHEVGIPFELAEKLTGETEEELRADAETLAKYTVRQGQPSPQYSSEKPVGDTTDAAYLSVLQNLKK